MTLWSDGEICKLINIWGDMDEVQLLDDARREASLTGGVRRPVHVYDVIAQRLRSSTNGTKAPEQCRTKLKKLRTEYRRVLALRTSELEAQREHPDASWRFFDLMQRTFAKREHRSSLSAIQRANRQPRIRPSRLQQPQLHQHHLGDGGGGSVVERPSSAGPTSHGSIEEDLANEWPIVVKGEGELTPERMGSEPHPAWVDQSQQHAMSGHQSPEEQDWAMSARSSEGHDRVMESRRGGEPSGNEWQERNGGRQISCGQNRTTEYPGDIDGYSQAYEDVYFEPEVDLCSITGPESQREMNGVASKPSTPAPSRSHSAKFRGTSSSATLRRSRATAEDNMHSVVSGRVSRSAAESVRQRYSAHRGPLAGGRRQLGSKNQAIVRETSCSCSTSWVPILRGVMREVMNSQKETKKMVLEHEERRAREDRAFQLRVLELLCGNRGGGATPSAAIGESSASLSLGATLGSTLPTAAEEKPSNATLRPPANDTTASGQEIKQAASAATAKINAEEETVKMDTTAAGSLKAKTSVGSATPKTSTNTDMDLPEEGTEAPGSFDGNSGSSE